MMEAHPQGLRPGKVPMKVRYTYRQQVIVTIQREAEVPDHIPKADRLAYVKELPDSTGEGEEIHREYDDVLGFELS